MIMLLDLTLKTPSLNCRSSSGLYLKTQDPSAERQQKGPGFESRYSGFLPQSKDMQCIKQVSLFP